MTVKTLTKSVYLAYSRREPAFAAEMKSFLAQEGFNVRRDLHGTLDRQLAEQLRESIKKSDVLVILATPALVHSAWLTLEVGIAVAWAKPTFLVIRDLPAESLPPYLQGFPRFAPEDLAELAPAIHKDGSS